MLGLIEVWAPTATAKPRQHGNRTAETHWVETLEREGLSAETSALPEIALSHERLSIRSAALRLLDLRDRKLLIPVLVRLLEDDSVYESFVAYVNRLRSRIGHQWEKDELPPLVSHFRQDKAILLAKAGEREKGLAFLDSLQAAETDPNRLQIIAAKRALLGDFSSYPHLVAASRSEDPRIRKNAVQFLTSLADEGLEPERPAPGERPTELLKVLARDEDAKVRQSVLFNLRWWRPDGADGKEWVKLLKSLAKNDSDPEVREGAKRLCEEYQFLGTSKP